MAFRIDTSIIRGEISNEIRGEVTGHLWLLGRSEPVTIRLDGNCLRDLAGCRLTFENPLPRNAPDVGDFSLHQTGFVGDMTASKKSRIPTVSDAELMQLIENKIPIPTRMANCLYLEWFSRENGRVVIETSEFSLVVHGPEWSMTANEERHRISENQENFHDYLDAIVGVDMIDDDEQDDFLEDDEEENEEGLEDTLGVERDADLDEAIRGFEAVEEPLNEFEWEQEFREADRHAEAYHEAWDRYQDHPNRDRLIAEALGIDPSATEAFHNEIGDFGESDPEDLIEDANDFMSEPEDRHHPLSRRAADFALRLQREAQAIGLMDNASTTENPLLTVVISIISLGGKLAAALDPSVQGGDTEPGFVIAMLKRAQIPLNEALHAISAVRGNHLTPEARRIVSTARRELFDLRKEILDIMQAIRKQN